MTRPCQIVNVRITHRIGLDSKRTRFRKWHTMVILCVLSLVSMRQYSASNLHSRLQWIRFAIHRSASKPSQMGILPNHWNAAINRTGCKIGTFYVGVAPEAQATHWRLLVNAEAHDYHLEPRSLRIMICTMILPVWNCYNI